MGCVPRDGAGPRPADCFAVPGAGDGWTDAQGRCLLLDLEQIGSLNVVGDEETARGVLNALACEFATNPWSDQIQATMVGLDDALARDLDRFRIHQVADVPALVRNLRADLEDRRDALNSYGVGGVLEARSRATDMESWAPHIVILAETPIGSLRDDLAELVARMPRLGIATIAQGDALVVGATVVVTSKEEAEYRSGGALPPLCRSVRRFLVVTNSSSYARCSRPRLSMRSRSTSRKSTRTLRPLRSSTRRATMTRQALTLLRMLMSNR